MEAHRGGLAKLDAGAKARLAKRSKDYALQQKTLKEEQLKKKCRTGEMQRKDAEQEMK